MVQTQPLPLALVGVRPAGNESLIVTLEFVPASPLFVTLIEYVPLEPLVEFPVCDFVTVKSGARALKSTLALSSPTPSFGLESGSVVSDFVTSALLLIEPVARTFAVISSVCVPEATLPTAQIPVLEEYVPLLGLLETNCKPAGSWSVISTFCAVLGPALVRVIVYVMFVPTTGLALLMVFVRLKSACAVTGVLALLESFVPIGSGVKLETWAVLTTGFGVA